IWANTPSDNKTLDLDRYHITAHGPPTTPSQQSQPTFLKSLPPYPWDNKRTFWSESRRSRALRLRPDPGHPLLGTLSPDATDSDFSWHNVLRLANLPWINGHQLQGQTVFP